ncbi:4'-phosphopantetheinyl transferase family protein [Ferruginibacter yonginensis]|uniref:Enterobactin synthase component D n=1 Tax=Ferruginibacter yonginensis TaxID=1310416 RepID=A0ABV8QVY3_9BACT
MPLISAQQLNLVTKIGVWHIQEPDNFFLAKVTLQRAITHPHKRLQHLAGRYLLQHLFADFPTSLIQIADTRKPFLVDEQFHFSISHCGDYAAAIVSRQNRVGVDIEVPHAKVERIVHKFLSEAEQALFLNTTIAHPHPLTMAWSIKEALFKWYGAGQVDFIRHMHINAITTDGVLHKAHCSFTKHAPIIVDVHNMEINGNNLSWVIT